LVFYPFRATGIPVSSEWIFWEFGLGRDGLLGGKIWQLATHAFLHGHWAHLLINLAGLLLLGSRIERIAGSGVLLKVFVLGVLAGGTAQLLLSPQPDQLLVGASGGISAMLLWLTTVSPEARAWLVPVSAGSLGRGILLSEAGFAMAAWLAPESGIGMVAHACHLGGGLVGLLIGKRAFGPRLTRERLLKDRTRREPNS
jgi:membrane associated rhomboid family serine protease